MERLTRKGGLVHYATYMYIKTKKSDESRLQKVVNALGKYEDTGLTPEQIEAQQQEIDDLKRRISQRDAMNLNQKNLIDGLIRDKDEQAGRIMQHDTALKECVGLLKDSRDILKDLSGLFVKSHKTTACTATLALIMVIDNTVKNANSLLGGKDDDSPSNNI